MKQRLWKKYNNHWINKKLWYTTLMFTFWARFKNFNLSFFFLSYYDDVTIRQTAPIRQSTNIRTKKVHERASKYPKIILRLRTMIKKRECWQVKPHRCTTEVWLFMHYQKLLFDSAFLKFKFFYAEILNLIWIKYHSNISCVTKTL